MVGDVVDKVEREALEVKVVEEEARDKEAESSKDYTGLIPEVAQCAFLNLQIHPCFCLPPLPLHRPPRCYATSLPGVSSHSHCPPGGARGGQ